jgi:hypothetical protein
VGDRDLDDLAAPPLPLAEEFVVEGAAVVAIEAVFVRVIEPLQREILSASRIGAIQKRAMMTQMRRRHRGFIGDAWGLA